MLGIIAAVGFLGFMAFMLYDVIRINDEEEGD